MKRYLRAASLAALSGVLSTPALAASVEALVKAGKHGQAYQQGLKELEAREGDPMFDMAFGTAALRSGNAGDALFAFERVLVLDPDNAEARLGLAEALLTLNNHKQARAELTVAGKTRLSQPQRDRLNRLMAASEQGAQRDQSRYDLWVGLDMGHDSNVNGGTYRSVFTNQFGIPRTLGSTAKEQSAYFHRSSVGGSAVHQLSEDRALFAAGHISQIENMGEEDFDTRSYRFNGGFSTNYKGDVYRIAARLEQEDVDSERVRNLWGIIGQHTFTGKHVWNRGWQQTLVTGMARIDYQQNETKYRDVDQFLIGLEGEKTVGDFNHLLRGYYIYETAEDELPGPADREADHNGRRLINIGWRSEYLNLAGLQSEFAPLLFGGFSQHLGNITPYSDLGITRVRHNGALFAAGKHRKQSIYDIKLGLDWEWSKRLSFRAEYNNRWTDANINVYDIERQAFELGVRYDLL